MSAIEYLIRVHADPDGYAASIHQFAATQHPDVRAMTGPVHYGHGKTAPAAMLAAICAARIETVSLPRDSRYAC